MAPAENGGGRPGGPAGLSPSGALVGRVLGSSYRILRRLAVGGMATVFEAEHVRLGRHVAVKVLGRDLDHDDTALARFVREAEIVSQLAHPHIVSVLDFDVTAEGERYLVLELLEGKSVEQLLEEEKRLPLLQGVHLALQMASGLSAAHRAGIVHRDLKPANIFVVDAPGEGLFVKLLDFGISKTSQRSPRLTGARELLGTPEYMAPEQARGHSCSVDARADVYALGLVTYEMLTGHQPFFADDIATVLHKVIAFEAPRASSIASRVPSTVDSVLARALAKRRDDRFASVLDFADSLADAAGCARLHASTRPAVADNGAKPPAQVGPHERVLDGCRGMETARTARQAHVVRPTPLEHRLVASIERARTALESGAIAEAVGHAESALVSVASAGDPTAFALVKRSEALLERVYRKRLGPKERIIVVEHAPSAERRNLSPRTAFLLSRLEGGVTVEEALDIAAMPRLDVLRSLVHLSASGAIRLVAPVQRRL